MRRPLPTLLFLSFALLCIPSAAWAQAGLGFPSSGGGSPTPPSDSYGWQIGLVDATSIVLVLSAASSDSESTGMLGIGGYLLGGPIVHARHGNLGRGFGSLALRVGLPVLVAKLATGMDDCDPEYQDFCGEDEMAYRIMGGLVGVFAAGALDWFVLGRVEKNETPPGLQVGGIRLQPTLYPSDSGAQLGVLGQF